MCRIRPLHAAYGNDDGVRGRLSHSKSPARPVQTGISYNSSNDHNKRSGGYRTDGWGTERGGPDMQSDCKMDYPAFPQTLEELELEYKRDAMDLGRIRDKDEDEENTKHREAVREMRESYMKRLAILRGMHIKQCEEFLQLDTQRRQQRALQQLSTSGFGSYKQPGYFEYDYSGGNPHYAGGSLPPGSRGRNQNSMENYPSSRSHDIYGGFQRQRPEEFRKAYNRY